MCVCFYLGSVGIYSPTWKMLVHGMGTARKYMFVSNYDVAVADLFFFFCQNSKLQSSMLLQSFPVM